MGSEADGGLEMPAGLESGARHESCLALSGSVSSIFNDVFTFDTQIRLYFGDSLTTSFLFMSCVFRTKARPRAARAHHFLMRSFKVE